jgi:hypothetical protein
LEVKWYFIQDRYGTFRSALRLLNRFLFGIGMNFDEANRVDTTAVMQFYGEGREIGTFR